MNVKEINGTSLLAATYEVDGHRVTLTLREAACGCGCITSVPREGCAHILAALAFRRSNASAGGSRAGKSFLRRAAGR